MFKQILLLPTWLPWQLLFFLRVIHSSEHEYCISLGHPIQKKGLPQVQMLWYKASTDTRSTQIIQSGFNGSRVK